MPSAPPPSQPSAARPAFTLAEVRERTYKKRDSWWTVLLVDPLAGPLVKVAANRTSITPDQLTLVALVLGLGSAACFWLADWPWLVAGALLFHFSFVLDCMDGKIARLKGTGSMFGTWLDFILDRVRVVLCSASLMGGQYLATGEVLYVWLVSVVIGAELIRYLSAFNAAKVRRAMADRRAEWSERLRERFGGPEPAPAAPPAADDDPEAVGLADAPPTPAPGTLSARFPLYARMRAAMLRHRIRTHLVSGIELEMVVFVVAPLLTGLWAAAIPVLTVGAAAALLLFEAVIIYGLWRATRAFDRDEKAARQRLAAA
ncbi:CDP-alcohol phosphatidyltransferase family protein [Allonocardiopsis opalescens]|uniref:CDP-alcohol phosphatidyltransferase-like enzyme n=1 Tax=Allonocardiopsis opalescens TaxID=1144618 RepID=A0A2T0PW51_9ACTN|nr:CDP-alcohol phosphatidyltransferase family protein [Allonocardiopsis opalescens]PRX95762.1 CDP-alcohol phosphatidyltransferase-like enzyme [Allonocardiopsis opalescens]